MAPSSRSKSDLSGSLATDARGGFQRRPYVHGAETDDLLEAASDYGLRILAGVFYPDWRYLLGGSRRATRRVAREARREVRAAARRFAGDPRRSSGSRSATRCPLTSFAGTGWETVANALDPVEVVREEDPSQLVTYANYPTAEYLPLGRIDFLTFNVFLERREDFRRYLTKLDPSGRRPPPGARRTRHSGWGWA